MKTLEKYFSQFWLNIIFRIIASELLVTAFFIFFGNNFNAKLWSDEERQMYALITTIQVGANFLLVYFESEYRQMHDAKIMADIEKSNVLVGEDGELVK